MNASQQLTIFELIRTVFLSCADFYLRIINSLGEVGGLIIWCFFLSLVVRLLISPMVGRGSDRASKSRSKGDSNSDE